VPQRISARIELKPAQQKVLRTLRETGSTSLTRGRYQALTGVSRSQAAYDIAELVEAGILERVGGGRSTSYRVAARDDAGRSRRWTSDRIRSELERFCGGRTTWPSAREFKRAGRTDLYVAVSRYGGVRYWAGLLGLSRDGAATLPRRRARGWSWAASGAATGALVAGVAVAIVHPWSRQGPAAEPARVTVIEERAAAPERPVRRTTKPRQRPKATPRTVHSSQAAEPVARTVVARAAATRRPPAVSRNVRTRPASSVSGRVTPLAAPGRSASSPQPLPAP